MAMQITIIAGAKQHKLKIDRALLDKDHQSAPKPYTVLNLKQDIENLTDIPADNQKLIYKGKSVFGNDVEVSSLKFRNGDQIMVLGQKKTVEVDPVMSAFENIEKTSVKSIRDKAVILSEEISDAEKGFLPDVHRKDQLRVLEKKLRALHEEAMRTIEVLDSMNLGDNPMDKHRSKRKQLVKQVQKHLDEHDILHETLHQLLDDNNK